MADGAQDFDLQILKVGDRYRANVIKSPAGEADGEFDLPFTGDELDDLFRGLGQARGATRGAASPEVATVQPEPVRSIRHARKCVGVGAGLL